MTIIDEFPKEFHDFIRTLNDPDCIYANKASEFAAYLVWEKTNASAAVSKYKEELSAKILPILESIDSCANSKLQEKEVEIAQHKKTHDFLVREGENIVEKHKSEIQKLHDHYQKQIGEWEERLKAADEFIRHVPLSGQDNVFGPNLYPTIGFIEALEKYESLKHQTPAPK